MDYKDKAQGGDKQPATKKIKLRLDVKDVVRPRTETLASADESADEVTVLYEDNHLLVVLKPQNIPTQADESGDKDMLTRLKEYLVKKYDKKGDAYLGLVHRLDRPTGGVMVFAKTSKAAARLCEQIKSDDDFEKTYIAVTNGRPNRTGVIEHYLVKDTKANNVTVAPSGLDGAKKAVSEIKIVDESKGLALVSVKLITGRSHQARVQLKALGSPIVGDYRYAGEKLLIKSKHLALWAYKLEFSHPVTDEKLKFIALPPKEFPWSEFDTESLVDIVRPKADTHYFN